MFAKTITIATVLVPCIIALILVFTGIPNALKPQLDTFVNALFSTGGAILTVLSIIVTILLESPPSKTYRQRIYVIGIVVFILECVPYYSLHSCPGGDVDPLAYLEGKTKYTGGYHYLVKKTTYREHVVSDKSFLNHRFSEYKILQHIPAITRIEDYSVSVGLGHFGMHSPQVTLTLSNAVIHVPYDELRLTKFFQDHSDSRGALEFLSTEYLKHLADPIFKRLQEYPPDTGSFGFDLSREHYSLGDLEKKYGIQIVTLPNQNAYLSFTITYSRPPNPDAPLFQQNEIKEMISSH